VAAACAAIAVGAAFSARAVSPAAPALAAPPARASAPEVTASVDRGRAIYTTGTRGAGPEITAQLASGDVVAASMLPCAGCHGRDGRGRPEGGVSPSDIRWSSLTRPYEVVAESGRRRAPYDERLVARAVGMGVDSSGQKLHPVMPRYALSRADLADVIAYLKVLGEEPDPGVTDTEIRVGVVLAEGGPLAESDRAARAVLRAAFDEVNRDGGIYGRRLALVSTDAPAEPSARAARVRAFLDAERPFALASLALRGSDMPLAALLDAERVPVAGAIAVSPMESAPRRFAFYLEAGPIEPTPAAQAELRRLGATGRHAFAEASALAAAKLLVEGLRRAGRGLSRDGFVGALERVHGFETGLGPPLSYGPNRHGGLGERRASAD
jgi:ABC-type branched-subunit amino acid transport system substrate-binding protein